MRLYVKAPSTVPGSQCMLLKWNLWTYFMSLAFLEACQWTSCGEVPVGHPHGILPTWAFIQLSLWNDVGYLTAFQEQGMTLLLYQLQSKIKSQMKGSSKLGLELHFAEASHGQWLVASVATYSAQPPLLPWVMAPAVCPPISNAPVLQARPLPPEELLLSRLEGQPFSYPWHLAPAGRAKAASLWSAGYGCRTTGQYPCWSKRH